jgi:hypothetical protein
MKKRLSVIILLIIIISLINSVIIVSAICAEKKIVNNFPEFTNPGFSNISGRVVNKYGFGQTSNVFFHIGKDPENSTFYKNVFNDADGYFKHRILTSGRGITLQIRAVIITFDFNGDKSQWEDLRVIPHNDYVIPDLVLPNWPRKTQQLFNPINLGFLNN